MGGGSWSSNNYVRASRTRKASGIDDFDYDTQVRSGKVETVHEDLDPTKMVNHIRESRDSDEHPESLPIAVIFDVTGSMGSIPRILQEKLPRLMDVVIDKAKVEHPQVLVGAVGDYHVDRFPFQVGQFESDNRFDEQLRNIILEGGGGGQIKESYGLAFRFAARHTETDSFEKRGKKGYLFTMGDESFWPSLDSTEIKDVFGITATENEQVIDLIKEAQEKWELFHLFSMDGSYPHHTNVHDSWREVLGERFVAVEDSSLICEIIASLIYALESSQEVDDVVLSLGISAADQDKVKNAIVPVVNAMPSTSAAEGTLPEGHSDTDDPLMRV
jgi:hypothetical protein